MPAPDSRIALITGAGSGIGSASAKALAAAGWSVVLAGRRQGTLEKIAAEIVAAGGQASAFTADVGQPASVAALFDAIQIRYGRLDLLFNNAGIFSRPTPIEDIAFADWQASVAANLTGVFLCAQHAIRMMKAQSPRGGRIINNGSISSDVPRPLSAPYTATKHGVTGLTRQIALDCRPFDIACGQIDVGNAASEMTEKMATGVLQADGSVAAEARMDVRHVADAVVYMAGLPLDANVLFMTVMATKMPFVGRG